MLTGFGPFLIYETNPSGEIAKKLDGRTIGGAKVVGRVLPVKHRESAEELGRLIREEKPDVVIATGLANQRGCVALERVALNAYYFAGPQEEADEPLYKDEREAYFSTLPLKKIKAALTGIGIPAEYSFWPDTFVSNEVFYEVMRLAFKLKIKRAGYIHLPIDSKQLIGAKIHYMTRLAAPSMSGEMLEKAVRTAIEESVK